MHGGAQGRHEPGRVRRCRGQHVPVRTRSLGQQLDPLRAAADPLECDLHQLIRRNGRAEVSEERDVGRDQRAAQHDRRKPGTCWWRDGLGHGAAVTHQRDTGRGLLAQIDLLNLSGPAVGGVLPMRGERQMDVGVYKLAG
jgi:hypothetical protein